MMLTVGEHSRRRNRRHGATLAAMVLILTAVTVVSAALALPAMHLSRAVGTDIAYAQAQHLTEAAALVGADAARDSGTCPDEFTFAVPSDTAEGAATTPDVTVACTHDSPDTATVTAQLAETHTTTVTVALTGSSGPVLHFSAQR